MPTKPVSGSTRWVWVLPRWLTLQRLVDDGTLTDKLARQVIDGVLAGEGEPADVVTARGLAVVSDEGALAEAVDVAIAANPAVAQKVRDGKVQAAGALIGAVMKAMKGQPTPRACVNWF